MRRRQSDGDPLRGVISPRPPLAGPERPRIRMPEVIFFPMSFFSTFHFDEDEYHCKLSADALLKEHHQKVVLLATNTEGVASARRVSGAMVTGGLSLLSAGYS